jgi:hypothetical protein
MRRVESVGYPLQPFETRLAELERLATVGSERLAFASVVDGAKTHQYYFDRFWKLASGDWQRDLLERAEHFRDGNRAAAHNYLTHHLHSYKGKFFPQIVRALVNYAGLGLGDSVVDPFVGSGTTPLEAHLMGCSAHGVDRNPLAALISETKIEALQLDEAEVDDAYCTVASQVSRSRPRLLPNHTYLARWFPEDTLRVVARTLTGIEGADAPRAFKNVSRLVLSANLRAWSLQEPSQLRIFRRATSPPAAALVERFAVELARVAKEISTSIRLVAELGLRLGEACVECGDARKPGTWGGRVHDALITSPPYATALPYIDTDRLSLFALGLLEVGERNDLEWSMIGNREIRQTQKIALEHALEANEAELPERICESILELKAANAREPVGFRRANLPALLYKYFWDMDVVLGRAAESLRPAGLCAIVVGDSHTVAGKTKTRIPTGSHLVACAESRGFELEERIPMGGQAGYLPHQRNMIPREEILLFRRAPR